MIPLVARSSSDSIIVEGRPLPNPGEQALIVRENVISPGYFRSMGIPLIRGRDFLEEEAWDRGGAIIINHALAERLFPGEDPLGRRVSTGYEWRQGYVGDSTLPWFTIVAVVANAVQRNLDQEVAAEMFHPYINPYNVMPDGSATLVVRGRPDVLPSVRAVVERIDASAAISNVAAMDEVVARALAPRHVSLGLFAAFAVVAVLLAAIGLYGALAYAVGLRAREIGVRLSMGARRLDVALMIVGEAGMLLAIAVSVGAAAALGLGRWMSSMLFAIEPWNPPAFATAIAVVTVAALTASVIPAIRASRVDPAELLR
jgi:putative ABC transport system permease protein